MAPVIATGTVGSRVRPSRYAVSSSVSVPWVTTMPRTSPDSATLRTRSRSAQSGRVPGGRPAAWPSPRSGTGRSAIQPAGAKPTSASPPWAGTFRPAAASRCMEMVPPVKRRWIIPQSTLPPFTLSTSPVMWRARSLQRNRIGPAMSSGGGDPAERDGGGDPLAGPRGEGGGAHLGVHPARRDAVDRDVRGTLDRERLGQRDERALGGGVVGVERLAPLARGAARRAPPGPPAASRRAPRGW